jgi:hypothetical protein
MEIWKDIEGYEGLYQVSNLGNIKSLNYNHTGKEKLRKTNIDKHGYLGVVLYKNKKSTRKKIHRLVAFHFCEGYGENLVVNHKDEDKTNNVWTNLEWITQKENTNYGIRNEKISKMRVGKYKYFREENGNFSSKSPQAKNVKCITTGEIFNCISDAKRKYNLKDVSGIIKSCKNNKYSSGKHPITSEKLYWEYYDEGGELNG